MTRRTGAPTTSRPGAGRRGAGRLPGRALQLVEERVDGVVLGLVAFQFRADEMVGECDGVATQLRLELPHHLQAGVLQGLLATATDAFGILLGLLPDLL